MVRNESLLALVSAVGVGVRPARRGSEVVDMIRICAWCNRIEDRDSGEWYVGDVPEPTWQYNITHGICPDCADEMEERENARNEEG